MAIRESEEKVRSILESAGEAIYGIDKDGNCTFYNPSCANLTGYTKPDELLGKNMHTLIHHSHSDGKPMPREQCKVALAMQEGKGIHIDDEVFWRADGTSFPVEVWSYPQVKEGVVTGMVVTFFDITERKKMEAAIKTNLGEKEMLLKEIHHRVKNNMQVISSLLQLQSQSLKDEGTKNLFRESMGRIKSIALVHEQLYRSDNLSQIEYGGYLRKMFGPLFESYKADARRIAMVIEADNVMVTIEKAVPCSLIVNEMMSNSLKYAFPGDKKGEIRINFALDESKENYVLDYSDNGIGLPEGFVPGKTGSLGTTLINGLTKQLKGTLTLVPGGQGVHYVIKFPSQELRGK
jgi:PAS domain S-box-containing protein